MKQLLHAAFGICCLIFLAEGSQQDPPQTPDFSPWLTIVPTNDVADLSSPDAPISLHSDDEAALPPLSEALSAQPPDAAPDEPAPEPDPEAPPPESDAPVVPPGCGDETSSFTTNDVPVPLGTGAGPLQPLALSLPAVSDERIRETARALDYNWARCYLFVRNGVRYTPCKGIQRGALRTLIDREGNDADQSLLLLSLLCASGYTNSTICYVSETNGGFRIPLGGTVAGYDACGWLGIAPDNLTNAYSRTTRLLQVAMLGVQGQKSNTLQTSTISVEHYWVQLTLNGTAYQLDPSFKPRVTSPARDILTDMGYTRTNLIAQAGGVATGYCVQAISSTNLAAELRRLATSLTSAWRATGTNSPSALVGGEVISQQDLSADGSTFHGTIAGTPIDFVAQSDDFKNARRYAVSVAHACVNSFSDSQAKAKVTFWLDELGDRALWFKYALLSGVDQWGNPVTVNHAQLMLDSTVLAAETGNTWTSMGVSDSISISVVHPFACNLPTPIYHVTRGNGYVYSVALGFGADHQGGMREVTQDKFESIPLSAGTLYQRAMLQQVVGQQWLAQTALAASFDSRLKNSPRHSFYNIGLTAATASPYVDLKNCLYYSIADASRFDTYNLFASSLEHGVLDQVNEGHCPAVSTVRIVDLANASNMPIYFVTSTNWATVKGLLRNYDSDATNQFDSSVSKSHRLLIPADGKIKLNSWSGYGYIDYGPNGDAYSTGMMIGGGLGGGFSSFPYTQEPVAPIQQFGYREQSDGSFAHSVSKDPIDLQSGACLADRADLSLSSSMPLVLKRHYDSRLRRMELAFGTGWTHNHDIRLKIHADPDAFLGHSTAEACAASAVASAVAADLAAEENALNLTLACMVVKWWTDQLVDGAATVDADGSVLNFTRCADGSFAAAPGVTATLTGTNGGTFTLQERLGRTWHFSDDYRLSNVTDPSGNSIQYYYNTHTNLIAVSNSFGQKLTFAWSADNKRINTLSDSAGRSLTYSYDGSHRLYQFNDPEANVWKLSYNADYGLATMTDPENVTMVQNTYNAFAQVTNQVAANGQRYTFAYSGVNTWERDPFGRRTFYAFTDQGRLSQRVDHDGTTNTLFYSDQGQVITNVDALGRSTVRVYDQNNNLLRLIEAANTTNARPTAFAYDDQSHLLAVTNALGRTTRMTYDGSHRLLTRVEPDGTTTTNAYDVRGLLISTRVLDAQGNLLTETTRGYGSLGLATNVAATDAGNTLYRYDKAGNVTNVVDALGRSSRSTYDDRGLLTATVDAATHTASRVYTKSGRLQTSTDVLDRDMTFRWTRSGNPASTVLANGGITTNFYDMADNLVGSKDPRGNRVDLALDSMGRTTNRYTSVWRERTWYDPSGSPTTTVDSADGRTDIGYDWLSRPVVVVDPMNRLWRTSNDPLNGVTNSVDARGRVTRYGLNLMGRRVKTTYPSGRTEGFGFDGLGRQTSFTNSEGRVYRMGYDGQGRLLTATNGADEQVFRNFYDACGNLTNRCDGAGRPTTRQYDALNHCTNTLYADGGVESFTYDPVGNLLTAKNAGTTNTFGYDSVDHLTSSVARVLGVTFTNRYRYDIGGLITNVVYPGGKTVRCFYDLDGRLTNLIDWATNSYRITRDAAGRVTSLTYPNGITGVWGYDASHAVTNWAYTGADGLPGRAIIRDLMGLKKSEDVTGPMPQPAASRRAANTFDSADRLVSARVVVGTNIVNETYSYDGCGALTNVARSAGTNDVYAYDLAGRVCSAGASSLSFSAGYDAFGNRIKTTVNGVTHLWAIDQTDPLKRPLMETTTNGTPIRYHIWGAGRLLAVIDADGTTRFAHCDDQGNVVALTSTNGAVLFTANYGPYGEPWGTAGTNDTPFGWLGGHGVFHADGSSLYLTRHRAYDTTLRRFLSQDPMGLAGGANLYGYGNSNPLAYIDPLGLCAENNGNVGGSMGAAGILEQAGLVRDNYNAWVAKFVTESGGYSPTRDAIRDFFNQPENSTPLSRGVAEMYRWEQSLNGTESSLANPTATAEAINNAAAIAKWGGRGLVGVGTAVSIYGIANASDPYRATAQSSSAFIAGTGGAGGGAVIGAAIGSFIPGPGTAIGAIVGGIAGGIGGGFGGHWLGGAAYESVNGF